MEIQVSDILTIIGTIGGVIWSLFFFFFNSKFKSVEDELKQFKETSKESLDSFKEVSKSDDKEVKEYLGKEIDKRVDQITSLHLRTGEAEKETGRVSDRVSRLEGIHEQRNK